MLIYAESKIFPSKTFVVLVHAGNKVAYLRAQLLHVLFEIGHEDHQFRLRYKGQYLRDAFSLLDYDLPENALVHMIPVSANTEAAFDVQSVSSLGSDSSSRYLHGVQDVVHKEIRHLSRRERMCLDFKTLLYVHFIATIFAAFTAFWYSLIWIGVLMMFGVFMCPTYTRLGGFVGKNMIWRVWFSIIYGVFGVCSVIAAITFAAIEWSGIAAFCWDYSPSTKFFVKAMGIFTQHYLQNLLQFTSTIAIQIPNHGCTGWVLVDECSPQHLYSSLFFTIHSVVQLTSTVIAWYLYWNFRYELGDFIEKYLVQEKSIDELMKTATMGRLKDKRMAAYELAILAASDDDNKFKIVEEGGLDVLLNLALSADEATQEYAMETLAELVTVLTIQDQFVEVDGVRTVVPLLHSSCERVVQETLLTLYNVIADSELNKSVIVADHGLEDIAHVAHRGSKSCQRIAASILLELAFNTEIRGQMAVTNTPAAALTELSKSDEPDTQRYALQTLELLAIERPQVIYAQDELMSILLTLHHRTLNENLYLLAGKILLYYAEDQQCSELLLADPHMTECLQTFAHSHDGLLQKVVVKIIDCMLDTRQHKLQADVLGFSAILTDIRANAADRETWDMADQALQLMQIPAENFPELPPMTTLEKLTKMETSNGHPAFRSQTSLRSLEPRSDSSEASLDVKKGIN